MHMSRKHMAVCIMHSVGTVHGHGTMASNKALFLMLMHRTSRFETY